MIDIKFQKLLAEADSWLDTPADFGTSESELKLTYLRIVLTRVRSGMDDFLVKAATPKSDNMTNKTVNVRVSKAYANAAGFTKIAQTMVNRFKEGDTTHDWESVNIERLGKMISAEVKFFAQNTNTEMMKFVTEAL